MGGPPRRKSDNMKFMSESSTKRVLTALSQAIPALYASDKNSGRLIIFGATEELCVSKAKASCGMLVH
jgi:hypothetical protein